MGTGYLFLLLEDMITKKGPGKGSINGLYLGVKWAKKPPPSGGGGHPLLSMNLDKFIEIAEILNPHRNSERE